MGSICSDSAVECVLLTVQLRPLLVSGRKNISSIIHFYLWPFLFNGTSSPPPGGVYSIPKFNFRKYCRRMGSHVDTFSINLREFFSIITEWLFWLLLLTDCRRSLKSDIFLPFDLEIFIIKKRNYCKKKKWCWQTAKILWNFEIN